MAESFRNSTGEEIKILELAGWQESKKSAVKLSSGMNSMKEGDGRLHAVSDSSCSLFVPLDVYVQDGSEFSGDA